MLAGVVEYVDYTFCGGVKQIRRVPLVLYCHVPYHNDTIIKRSDKDRRTQKDAGKNDAWRLL